MLMIFIYNVGIKENKWDQVVSKSIWIGCSLISKVKK